MIMKNMGLYDHEKHSFSVQDQSCVLMWCLSPHNDASVLEALEKPNPPCICNDKCSMTKILYVFVKYAGFTFRKGNGVIF